MTAKLFISAIIKFGMGVLLVGLLLFLPAGTFRFFGGWLLMGVLFVPMFWAGIILFIKNPALLEKRLDAKEKQKEQGLVVTFSGLMFLAGFIVAGLGVRFDWFTLPRWVSLIGAAVFLASYLLYGEVLRENTYLSRTIEVQNAQTVIDTGLYSVVRHPMYAATILMFLAIPLILGSLYSFLIFLAYPILIGIRIRNEEALLARELDGYTDYQKRVKYRLIPFVW